LRQFRALLPISLGQIRRAKWPSITITACVALVVLVLLVFLGMARGFEATALNAGSDDIAVFLGRQSNSESTSRLGREQIEILRAVPGIALDGSRPLFSSEFSMTVGGQRADGTKVNVNLRGLEAPGISLRKGFRITEGRMYKPGLQELIVGRSLASQIDGAQLNEVITLVGREWTIVGLFALDSTVFETEFWADLATVQSAYGRENQFQSVRARLIDPSSIAQVRADVALDPRLDLDVQSERQLYHEQVKDTSNLITYLGWPLAGVLAIGCLSGVLNTMYITLYARRQSLAMLRLIGYSASAIVASVVVEVLLLSVVGALVGAALVYLLLDGASATTLGVGFTTINYHMQVDWVAVLQALSLALFIGTLGAAIPAARRISGRPK
jgi:putative ABC transport system permease protein